MSDTVSARTGSDVLLQLAERCEREEPSRELDVKITLALYDVEDVIGSSPSKYTSSLDAAVTLVPPNTVCRLNFGAAYQYAELLDGTAVSSFAAKHKTSIALALCAAALRARAALLETKT